MKLRSYTSLVALAAFMFFDLPLANLAQAQQAPEIQVAGSAVHLKNGSFTGQPFDAYYGLVQVQANVSGGKLVSVDVLQSPGHQRTSRYINNQALPLLQQEVIQAQSFHVNIISGATLTSRAYARSLRDALGQASQ
jgi:uncharacterized protein with FMN-binding domain